MEMIIRHFQPKLFSIIHLSKFSFSLDKYLFYHSLWFAVCSLPCLKLIKIKDALFPMFYGNLKKSRHHLWKEKNALLDTPLNKNRTKDTNSSHVQNFQESTTSLDRQALAVWSATSLFSFKVLAFPFVTKSTSLKILPVVKTEQKAFMNI